MEEKEEHLSASLETLEALKMNLQSQIPKSSSPEVVLLYIDLDLNPTTLPMTLAGSALS